MTVSEQTLKALQELIQQDQELLVRVQACADADESAALISNAAAQQGICVSQAELLAHFLGADSAGLNMALSDDQLDAVAGGISDDAKMALISVFSFGIGCAMISISQALGKEGGNVSGSPLTPPPTAGGIVTKYC